MQKKFRRSARALLVALGIVAVSLVGAQEEGTDAIPDLVAEGDQLEFRVEENLAIYRGNVKVNYQGFELHADEAHLNRETLDVEAIGNVRILHENAVTYGDHATGNLRTRGFEFTAFQGTFGKWTFKGTGASRTPDGAYTVRDVAMSMCEDWWLHASEVVHRENGDFRARNVTWRLMGAPLMYLPVLTGNTNDQLGSWRLRAGHQSDWGFYIMLARAWELGELGETELGIEYRTARGVALRNETTIRTENSFTEWLAYGMLDSDPLTERTINGQDYNNRFEAEEERYRLKLYHEQSFTPGLMFRGKIDAISDNDMLLEFFRDEYDIYPEPASFADLTYLDDRFILSAHYRQRVNDFFTSVERLPELRLDLPRQALLGSNLHYQGSTSFARLHAQWRDYDLPRSDGAEFDDYDAWRFDTLHMFYYPLRLDWLNIVPRAGVRYTRYSDSSYSPLSDLQIEQSFTADDPRADMNENGTVFNFDNDGGTLNRTLLELGTEISFKTSRTMHNYQSERWRIDGLRHVVEPYLNYTYISDPDDREHIYYFDQVDRILETNMLRAGVKQRLQTRRNQRIYTLARLENYVDFHFDPQEDDLPREGDIGTVLQVNPVEQVSLWLESLVGYDDWRMNVLNVGATYYHKDFWRVGLGYLLRNDYRSRYLTSMGSDLTEVISETIPHSYTENHNLQLTFGINLTPSVRFETQHYFDLDRGELGQQMYQLTRESKCWETALRLEENGEDFRVMLLFMLKGLGRIRAGS